MKAQILKFLRDEDGLTMVEYAVAGGLVTLGAVIAFGELGGAVSSNINDLCTAVDATADCDGL